MENMVFEFPAAGPVTGRALAGVVASGDLEVLLEPSAEARTTVTISTSVDGFGKVWEAVLNRMLGGGDLPAARVEINDFGATPGVVRMRIAQAFEQVTVEPGSPQA